MTTAAAAAGHDDDDEGVECSRHSLAISPSNGTHKQQKVQNTAHCHSLVTCCVRTECETAVTEKLRNI